MSDKLRIGASGWGLRGGLAAIANKPDEGSELVALADLSEKAHAKFKERLGEDRFVTTDYLDLLKQNLDAVFVMSPDWLHEEHACTLLNAGMNLRALQELLGHSSLSTTERYTHVTTKDLKELYHTMNPMEFLRK